MPSLHEKNLTYLGELQDLGMHLSLGLRGRPPGVNVRSTLFYPAGALAVNAPHDSDRHAFPPSAPPLVCVLIILDSYPLAPHKIFTPEGPS